MTTLTTPAPARGGGSAAPAGGRAERKRVRPALPVERTRSRPLPHREGPRHPLLSSPEQFLLPGPRLGSAPGKREPHPRGVEVVHEHRGVRDRAPSPPARVGDQPGGAPRTARPRRRATLRAARSSSTSVPPLTSAQAHSAVVGRSPAPAPHSVGGEQFQRVAMDHRDPRGTDDRCPRVHVVTADLVDHGPGRQRDESAEQIPENVETVRLGGVQQRGSMEQQWGGGIPSAASSVSSSIETPRIISTARAGGIRSARGAAITAEV